MPCPIRSDVGLVQILPRGRRNLAAERRIIPLQRHDVQHHMKIFLMQFLDHGGRVVSENIRVELERVVSEIPARRAKARAQINHRVARQLFFAEGAHLGQIVRFRRKGAVRLHVTKRPFRRHHRRARQPHELAHGIRRLLRVHDKHIGAARNRASLRMEHALALAQIKIATRFRHEQRPSFRADQERNVNPRTIGQQRRRSLAVLQRIKMFPAVELRAALAQPQQRRRRLKDDGVRATFAVELQFLHQRPVRAAHKNGERLRRDGHAKLAGAHLA